MSADKITIAIPELSLIVLVGSTGAGKSHFCRKNFKPTQVVSSDFCRGMLSDDMNDQSVTDSAFELLHTIAGKRLDLRKSTVIDATSLRSEDRKGLIDLARKFHILPVAIVFDIPEKTCWERTQQRDDRDLSKRVIHTHHMLTKRTLKEIRRDGFTGGVHILHGVEETDNAEVVFTKMFNDKRDESGPFDIIGDIHGCYDELIELIEKLGYVKERNLYRHPSGRKLVFVGDLVDRGPKIIDSVRFVMDHVAENLAYTVRGNHDKKFSTYLRGRNVAITHGLEQSIAQYEALPEAERAAFMERYLQFEKGTISHYVFDRGNLVVAHAGIKEYYHGRGSPQITDFCMYGETTGEVDGFGLPVRIDWAEDYRGKALVVYGHVPVEEPEFVNNTIAIDQGCVFGGKLTALRYPEREAVSIEARAQYYTPLKPISESATQKESSPLTKQQRYDRYLSINELLGKRFIKVPNKGSITIFPEQMEAALEVASRFCVDHRWLVYIPPTMSPCETSGRPEYLEHPDEAFAYFRQRGIPRVVCEEKHMGSRAILILCKDEEAGLKRFGTETIGECYTRTGRRFFKSEDDHKEILRRLSRSLTDNHWWEKFETDWAIFDCEIVPWNLKAGDLLLNQYEIVAASGKNTLWKMFDTVAASLKRGIPVEDMRNLLARQLEDIEKYHKAYQPYCWKVASLDDVKIAPFHLLATEDRTYTDKTHLWHMEELGKFADFTAQWRATPHIEIETVSEESCRKGVEWWIERTGQGSEGMVVKPLEYVAFSKGQLVQPALKCRGKEYLRIIYGPSYDMAANLERLKKRGLKRKRGLAEKEFLLGAEGLNRLVRNEPLRRVHECVLGVLAMESEPVDPRL